MRCASRHLWLVLAGLLVPLATGAPAAVADEAASIYSPEAVVEIKLTLSEQAEDELEAEPDEYVPGTFSLAETDGGPGGVQAFSPPIEVGIRLKGTGSFQDLGGKAAFKLKFNEVIKDQTFLGLKKMTLNNMVQDASMVHETLAYEAFRSSGVPAPRTGYAYVKVNDHDYGLYLNVETLDVIALERMFGPFVAPPQHLYEGNPGVDVRPGAVAEFELDEGKKTERLDLEALIAAVNSSGPTAWATRVAAVADLEEMTRMWALEKFAGHWDGYAGEADLFRPNNYYLYSDPSGRFQMLPTGTDQTWEHHTDFGEADGLMFGFCLEDPVCLELFRAALRHDLVAIEAANLDSLAAQTAALLEPWQELEVEPRRPYSAGEIEAAVAATRKFIAGRPAEARDWLPPEPPAPEPPVSGPPAPPAGAPGPLLGGLRAHRAGRVLRTDLTALVAGRLSQRATIATRGGRVRICAVKEVSVAAGPAALECRLGDAVRKRLQARYLRVKLRTQLTPSVDAPEIVTRRITLPRN
jgi:hypothetical protein